MSAIHGFWYPAGSSQRLDAELSVDGDRFLIKMEDGSQLRGQFSTIAVSPRVGSIPRKLSLPNQSVFETLDNQSIDQLLSRSGRDRSNGWLHRLESRWHWIGVALVAVLIVAYSSVRWGLPWVSDSVARQIPQSVLIGVSESSLELLDKLILKPSELDAGTQDQLRRRFTALNANPDDGSFKLYFRKMGGPNALALPNGDLVVTDAFARMATPDEFTAVMLHEIGHVEHRHGMQQLVRSSIISFVAAMVIGDPSGVEELFVALPLFILQSSYSRQHEFEADNYAFEKMMAAGIDPIHFATIMQKMDSWHKLDQDADLEDSASGKKNKNWPGRDNRIDNERGENELDQTSGDDDKQDTEIIGYLSSHPATSERIRRAEQYSVRFNKQ